ncbi:MAG: hypothetical protein WCH57_10420 [Verrucomicrobiota bacterium]
MVRAKEAALNEELVKLAVAPLEVQLRELLKTVKASNPKALELREKIAQYRIKITGEVESPAQQAPPASK